MGKRFCVVLERTARQTIEVHVEAENDEEAAEEAWEDASYLQWTSIDNDYHTTISVKELVDNHD